MTSKLLLLQCGAVLILTSCLAAQPAAKSMPTNLTAMVKEIDKLDKPAWTKDVDMGTDRACSVAFYGQADSLHRIRLIVGLSNSDVTCDYYYSGTALIFVSERHQVVFTYSSDGKEIYQPDPNCDELQLGFAIDKVVYESRKGNYFESDFAVLAEALQKEAKELNTISEKDKTVNLEHWQK